MEKPAKIAPAKGKLGILLPGMGAVSTTFMAGVELIRRNKACPIGSLTQMGTIRLGKRTEGRSPLIKKFVPLADPKDLVFGGWDIFKDNAYQAAAKAGVLSSEHLAKVKTFLSGIRPMKAAFDREYVKRLDGSYVKKAKNKYELALQITEDIAPIVAAGDLLVRVHGSVHQAGRDTRDTGKICRSDEEQSLGDSAVDAVCVGFGDQRSSLCQRRAQPDRGHPGDSTTGS